MERYRFVVHRLTSANIQFLDDDCWNAQYDLTLELYDAISEAACVINDRKSVSFYTESVFTNARCYDDKLKCE